MRYKKERAFKLLLMLCIVQLSFVSKGCGKWPEESENIKLDSIAKNDVSVVKPPQGKEIVNGMEINYIEKESQAYNFETDYNNIMSGGVDIKSGIMLYDDITLTFNKNLKKGQIFCGRPDCTHRSTACMSISMFGIGLQYYNGAIYEVDCGALQLIKKSLDAVTSDVVAKLITVDHAEVSERPAGSTPNWIIHRGYIYYIYCRYATAEGDAYYLNNSHCLFRKSLEGNSEPECIMPLTKGIHPHACELSAVGSYIYIEMKKNADLSDYNIDIYRYNTETDMVESFQDIDKNIVSVSCNQDGFYYAKNEGGKSGEIYFYDNREHKKEKLMKIEENIGNLCADEDYVYITEGDIGNDRGYLGIGIYDYSGNKLHEVEVGGKAPSDSDEPYIRLYIIGFAGSDDDYIYFRYETVIDDDIYNIWGSPCDFYEELMVIDKSKFKEGKIEYEIWGK